MVFFQMWIPFLSFFEIEVWLPCTLYSGTHITLCYCIHCESQASAATAATTAWLQRKSFLVTRTCKIYSSSTFQIHNMALPTAAVTAARYVPRI